MSVTENEYYKIGLEFGKRYGEIKALDNYMQSSAFFCGEEKINAIGQIICEQGLQVNPKVFTCKIEDFHLFLGGYTTGRLSPSDNSHNSHNAHNKQSRDYKSISYRLRKSVANDFVVACDHAGMSQTDVLTQLMTGFINEQKGRDNEI